MTAHGAHIPLGAGGELQGEAGAAVAFAGYMKKHNGNHYKAAQEFYKNELMNHPAKAKMGALGEKEVHFTGGGLKKLQQNMKNEPTKAALTQHLSSIISEGKYLGETKPHKDRNDFVSFHHFQKKVDLDGKSVNVLVDVGRRPDGKYEFSAYNLAHSDSSRFESKKTGLRSAGLAVEDAKKGATSDKGELSQSLEASAFSKEGFLPKDIKDPHQQKAPSVSDKSIPQTGENVNMKYKMSIARALRRYFSKYPRAGQ
jgi:hypothetical protein